MIRALLLCILLLSFAPALAEEADVSALLHRNDTSGISDALGIVQRRFEHGEATEYELREAFRPFYNLDALARKRLLDWVARSPRSYVAHLALGIHYKRLGAAARGTDYIANVPQQNLDEMNRDYRLADIELRRSLELTEKPYLSLFHLLDITGNSGDRDASEALLVRANKVLPGNALVRDRYAIYLLPRWGGSYAQLDRFIARSVREGAPARVIMQLRAIEHEDMGHVAGERGDQAVADEEFRAALELGQQAGGTFSVDFLPASRYRFCRGSDASPLCR